MSWANRRRSRIFSIISVFLSDVFITTFIALFYLLLLSSLAVLKLAATKCRCAMCALSREISWKRRERQRERGRWMACRLGNILVRVQWNATQMHISLYWIELSGTVRTKLRCSLWTQEIQFDSLLSFLCVHICTQLWRKLSSSTLRPKKKKCQEKSVRYTGIHNNLVRVYSLVKQSSAQNFTISMLISCKQRWDSTKNCLSENLLPEKYCMAVDI